ncbi:UNVERIFIED_CONTAM: hypothetical protein HHA_449510 [Hammondia hammondi]|eukprot:XP_008882212.1 hypothetical protein HHA_449510 [Hammondia hammondi]
MAQQAGNDLPSRSLDQLGCITLQLLSHEPFPDIFGGDHPHVCLDKNKLNLLHGE